MEQMERLERLHHLIRRKATGRPEELAEKLGVSRRTVFKLLEVLKELGAPVEYCGHRQSYYYDAEVKFRFEFIVRKENETKIKGGQIIADFFWPVQDFCTGME